MNCSFIDKSNLDNRKNESAKIRKKYPDRIPIIVLPGNKRVPVIDKSKYLVPNDITVGQFLYIIRKRIKLNNEKALFLFVNKNILPSTNSLISDIDKNYQNEDGFIYFTYIDENTFG